MFFSIYCWQSMLYDAPSFTSLFCEVWTTGTPLSLSFHFKIPPFKLWTFKQVAFDLYLRPSLCIMSAILPNPSTHITPTFHQFLCPFADRKGSNSTFWRSIFHCFSHPKQRCVFNFICRTLSFICLLINFRVSQVTFLEVFTQPFVSSRLQTHRTPTSRSHFFKLNLTILDPLVFLHSHD